MRKSLFCLAVLWIGAASLSAQNNGQDVKKQTQEVKTDVSQDAAQKAYISVQGGGLFSLNENFRTYGEKRKNSDLLTGQGSVAFGYQFTPVSGFRIWAGYGGNRGACNSEETSDHRFYPYKFNSVNAFVDYVMDFSGFSNHDWTFVPKIYAGVGVGNTFSFKKTPDNPAPGDLFHPWQKVSDKNTAFGFRGGLILEYMISRSFGILADFGGEFYTDDYNGINSGDEVSETGDKNFPFDFRGLASLGFAIHF